MSRFARCMLSLLLLLLASCETYDGANRADEFGVSLDERTGKPMESVDPNDPTYSAPLRHQPKFPGQPAPVVIPPQ